MLDAVDLSLVVGQPARRALRFQRGCNPVVHPEGLKDPHRPVIDRHGPRSLIDPLLAFEHDRRGTLVRQRQGRQDPGRSVADDRHIGVELVVHLHPSQ